jgi:hypothetical protein
VNNTASCFGSGTVAAPYCAIQYALGAATAGTDIRIQNSGKTYDETDTLSVSGTSTSPIYIEADNPSSPPTLTNTGNTGQQSYQMDLSNVSNVVVQNLKWDGTGANVAETALEIDCQGASSSTGVSVYNNTFTNWAASNTTTSYSGLGNYAIWLHGKSSSVSCSGFKVVGNTIIGSRGDPIETWFALGGTVVSNNTISGTVCGLFNNQNPNAEDIHIDCLDDSSTDGGITSNMVVQYNTMKDTSASCPFGIGSAGYQEFSGIHVDDGCSAGTINGNLVTNLSGTSTNTAHVGIHIEQNAHGWLVENNVIHDITDANGQGKGILVDSYQGKAGANNLIYNNTVYNNQLLGIQFQLQNNIENNILYNNGIQIGSFDNTETKVTVDYNTYYDNNGGNHVGQISYSGGIANFENWKAACSTAIASTCDLHSINANPNMVSPSSGNFELSSGSPAIDAGTTLSQVPVDILGYSRPQSTNYSIGAYEYPQ